MGTTRTTEKRTDDETVPAQAAAAEEEKAAGPEGAETGGAEDTDAAEEAVAAAGQDDDNGENGLGEDGLGENGLGEDGENTASAPPATGVAAGAGAVVAAGLGLASVTGTWLGTLMAERQALLGQIKLQTGKATDQIATVYGTPWHTTALVNGVFAVLAAIVAAVVLTRPRAPWVRAVAWAGLALAVLGILISAGMYLDLFGSLPSIPKGPGPGA
ncbi:hypothetical protein [Streptomyces sp. NPDC059008]|uniref:hypothetical protein n=1 Tax=Streptomyces sp. NPDC059008 TaxID=3346693 RepID=UPI00368EA814